MTTTLHTIGEIMLRALICLGLLSAFLTGIAMIRAGIIKKEWEKIIIVGVMLWAISGLILITL